ncbi:MAG: 30S ribosome-binding factor RbfA, partial [Gemmatimonadota bacterium]|nr:30S ribosome-binding factor RbfA [Gemmatimonadota bacterium]
IAETLTTQIKDPRIRFVTVTGVTVSPDLSHALVRISIMGTEEEKSEAMDGLEHAKGFVKSVLAKQLELRIVPDLQFVLDRGLEHARKIDELLEEVKKDSGSPQ